MARMTGKRAVMEMLKAEGVSYVFGNPGTSEGGFMQALSGFPEIKYILAVQEGVAVGMADAYARATGTVGFLQLHIDSGLLNGFSLLNDSFAGGTPLVVVAGNKDIRKLAEGRSDLAAMAAPYAKWSVEMTHPEQAPSVMRRAFQEARTLPRGPVFVGLSANALDGEGEMEIATHGAIYPSVQPDLDAVDKAAERLASASNPVMLIGDRLAENRGQNPAVAVAERLGARVYTHGATQMCFPTSHPQFVGPLSLRNPQHREAIRKADVVLAVGANVFSDFFHHPEPVLGPRSKLVHFDSNASAIGRSEPTAIGVAGSEALSLSSLDAALGERMTGASIEEAQDRARSLAREKQVSADAFRASLEKRRGARPMSPATMMSELSDAMPADTVVCDDAVSSKGALHAARRFDDPDALWGQRGGAIGWGMGATLGLKLAYPDRPVVGVIGDGSAMMTVQALWTAAVQRLPVVYAICNNASYRVLKVNMDVYVRQILRDPDLQPSYLGADFDQPFDFASLARGFGVYGRRIEDPAAIGPEMQRAIESGEPAVLDIVIDGSV